ncbi:DNA breaking-rejoining enzyme, partial [Schizophyllum amplum]
CDSIDFKTGAQKPASQLRSGISTAMKIRAAMTYLFGILCGLGREEWRRDHTTGKMVGNPSISPKVSCYMVALKRRKAHEGDCTEASRAITLVRAIPWEIENLRPRLLQCAYTLSLICLLRIEEVLQIRMQDLEWSKNGSVTLRLPFRKTHQTGKIIPFVIWPLEEDEAAICPKRALCEWLQASGIREGYLFPKLTSDGRAIKPNRLLYILQSQAVFLEMFRNNLLDVNIDFTPYGTHSFRRGGCQYLILFRRWNIRRVCEWGGWSTDFTYLTIVKYLISWVDEPMSSRADFFRPGQKVARWCRTCGRNCPCNS